MGQPGTLTQMNMTVSCGLDKLLKLKICFLDEKGKIIHIGHNVGEAETPAFKCMIPYLVYLKQAFINFTICQGLI